MAKLPSTTVMDLSAVNWNVTIDDFDSLLTYGDPAQWTTPDPSASNYSTAGPWFRGTYHKTETKGASVSLNITGEYLEAITTEMPLNWGCCVTVY